MHSLIGCFLISQSNNQEDMANIEFHEEINGIMYRRIELKLSHLFKRVFYLTEEVEYDRWKTQIELATGHSKITDKYIKSDLLGQGSFGKVYKGKSKTTDEIVAMKYIDKKAMKPHEI